MDLTGVTDWVVGLAALPGVYPVLYLFATIDGFFPPIPSESVVIALAALHGSSGVPNLWLVMLVAALGAFTGDQIAYSIGKHVPIRRLRYLRGARAQQAFAWAERALAERGASFIIAARYIPVGRVAVNMTAGGLGYPRRRFTGLAAIAAVTWAAYSTLLGLGAGAWLGDQPLAAVAVGVAGGILLGWVIDAVLARLGRRGAVAPAAVGPPAVADGAGLGAEREELGEDGAGLGADREGLGEDGVTAPEQPV